MWTVYTGLCVWKSNKQCKTVLRRCLCIVSVLLDDVFRSHPAASASQSDRAKRPWGLDEWEVRGATCYWTGPLSCSISVGGLCVCVYVYTYTHPCPCVYMALLVYMCGKQNSHSIICAATACSCWWVSATHRKEQREGTGEGETGELQVT